jgi:hypothetical protein
LPHFFLSLHSLSFSLLYSECNNGAEDTFGVPRLLWRVSFFSEDAEVVVVVVVVVPRKRLF